MSGRLGRFLRAVFATGVNSHRADGSGAPRRATLGCASLAIGLVLVVVPSAQAACSKEALRAEQHATYLPDCRAYEQVSPVNKNGGDVLPNGQRVQAALDGNSLKYSSLQGFGELHGSAIAADYVAKRGPSGWATHGINPIQEPTSFAEVLLWSVEPRYLGDLSPDLSRGVFFAKSPIGAVPNDLGPNLYLRDDLLTPGAGNYTLLSDSVGPQSYDPANQPAIANATADFSHVLFESTRNLTQDAVDAEGGAGLDASQAKLYEWVSDGVDPPATRLLGQVPTAPATECGAGGPACSASLSEAGSGALNNLYTNDTLSRDGSRAIFTLPNGSGCGFLISPFCGDLYLRDDHGTFAAADDTTTQINASELGSPESPQQARFWAASSGVDAEGHRVPLRVFFTSAEKLTEDDPNKFTDLYMWSEQADGGGHHLTRLSVDSEPADGDGAGVSGVLGASADGSYVYFTVTQGQLVAGGPTGPTGGPIGGGRIFVWHEGTLHEVGAVNEDSEENRVIGLNGSGGQAKWSRITPDGRHLAFVTQGTNELLTLYGAPQEYDHGTSCPNLSSPECQEIYVYDATANAGAGSLQCASCNPTGQAATADADFYGGAQELGAANDTSHLNHPLSEDGKRVFFNSAEALVPEDTTNGVTDAYEWEAEGSGGCEEPEGCIHLLSSGTDSSPSYFMDATPSGSDVFLVTRKSLVGWDTGSGRDVYDARIDGGFPEPAPAPAICQGDSCQGTAAAQPPATTPATGAPGPGNRHHRRKHRKRHHKQRHHKQRHHRHSTRSHG